MIEMHKYSVRNIEEEIKAMFMVEKEIIKDAGNQLSDFRKHDVPTRLEIISSLRGLSAEEKEAIRSNDVDNSENAIGEIRYPLKIIPNLRVNGREYTVPMAVEEPSIIAGCSKAAKIANVSGGCVSSHSDQIMIGQIQLIDVPDLNAARQKILENKEQLIAAANTQSKHAIAKDILVAVHNDEKYPMVVISLYVDVGNAMGANVINKMCEFLAPKVEAIGGGMANMKIISNYATERTASSYAVFKKDMLSVKIGDSIISGEEVVRRMLNAWAFAQNDVYRAVTHNKGIMNGVDPILVATYNDSRAVEAGAHAYAARTGRYLPLTKYEKNKNGDLVIGVSLPVQIGVVGGAYNKYAEITRKILNVKDSGEFMDILSAVALLQNFAAVYSLVTEGINKGHMRLQAREYARKAGAQTDVEIDKIVELMLEKHHEGSIPLSMDLAKKIMSDLDKSA